MIIQKAIKVLIIDSCIDIFFSTVAKNFRKPSQIEIMVHKYRHLNDVVNRYNYILDGSNMGLITKMTVLPDGFLLETDKYEASFKVELDEPFI